jgi:hypothetical protein
MLASGYIWVYSKLNIFLFKSALIKFIFTFILLMGSVNEYQRFNQR